MCGQAVELVRGMGDPSAATDVVVERGRVNIGDARCSHIGTSGVDWSGVERTSNTVVLGAPPLPSEVGLCYDHVSMHE